MKISIVTATFNSVATLSDCLDSVSAQSYRGLEHVVIDGASTDGTLELLESRRADFGFLVSEPDRGIYDALNKGIDRATGDVIGFLHSDDIYATNDVIERVAEAFSDPAVTAVYGDLEYVSRSDPGRIIRKWRAGQVGSMSIFLGWMPPHPTLFVRRSIYQSIGGFERSYRIAADYHSVLRMFKLEGFQARYLPKVLVKMRVGGVSNKSLGNIWAKSMEDLSALKITRTGGVLTLAAKNLRKVPQFFA